MIITILLAASCAWGGDKNTSRYADSIFFYYDTTETETIYFFNRKILKRKSDNIEFAIYRDLYRQLDSLKAELKKRPIIEMDTVKKARQPYWQYNVVPMPYMKTE